MSERLMSRYCSMHFNCSFRVIYNQKTFIKIKINPRNSVFYIKENIFNACGNSAMNFFDILYYS